MKSAGFKRNLIIMGILIFFLGAGLSIAPAENRTPPYRGWKPTVPFEPFENPGIRPKKKDIRRPAAVERSSQKQPAQKPSGMKGFTTEEYVVREGDWIAKILREKGVLTKSNYPKLLKMLREFNRSMKDLNLIKPGDKIVILVKVGPGAASETIPETPKPVLEKATPLPETPKPAAKRPTAAVETAQEIPLRIGRVNLANTKKISTTRVLKSEPYRIKKGDILSRIAINRYDLSSRTFATEYLDLFKKCNPTIKNPDRILVGQRVNLPLYPPQWYEEVSVKETVQPPIMRDLAGSGTVRLPDPRPLPEIAEPGSEDVAPPAAKRKPMTAQKSWIPKATAPEPEIAEPPVAETKPPEASAPEPITAETPIKEPEAAEAPLAAAVPPVPEKVPMEDRPSRPAVTERAVETTWRTQNAVLVSKGLGDILPRMGEKWISTGEHFIPMKSGGHINLKADTYPIIKRFGGMTLIVDLHNSLPPRMGRVIESSWKTYRVVNLSPGDDLRSAFGKILKALQYPKVFKKGKPLKLSGAIPVTVTGDWIVIPPRTDHGGSPGFIVINFLGERKQGVPPSVKAYLNEQGVRVVEFPSPQTGDKPSLQKAPETALDAPSLVEMVLTLTGHPHQARAKIPAFESQNDDFRLTITADFYLNAYGRERVIDLSGMEPEVKALLKERGISVLSLSKEKNPLTMASKILKFLGWDHKMGPHTLSTAPGSNQNVKLTLSGVVFFTENGHSVFMTPVDLPPELALFLYEKGYRVVMLTASPGADDQRPWRG